MRNEEIHTEMEETWTGGVVTDPLVAQRRMVDRYLRNQMGAEEQAAFEEHYLDCPACLDELAAGRRLREAWRQLASEEIRERLLRGELRPTGKVLAFPERRLRFWRAAALAALVLLAFGAGRLVQLQGLPEQLRAARQQLAEVAKDVAGPVAHTRLVLLGSLRGDTAATPLRLDRGDLQIVLMVPVEAEAGDEHTVELRRGGELVWSARGVRANRRRELLITMPPSYLEPGVYELRVEGPHEQAVHPFAVEAAQDSP
jgi:hypothetical protein